MRDPYATHEHPEFVPECFRPDPAIDVLIGVARCCRRWLVLTAAPIGRCGICGERPVLVQYPKASAR